MSNAALEDETETVAACARVALTKANGDIAGATKLLVARVRRDAALRNRLLEPLVEYACRGAITAQSRVSRAGTWHPTLVSQNGGSDADRVRALAAGTLLMFPLPGGKPLGEASREEISHAAQFYERQAGDMAHKARWLQLVAQSVPQGRKAGLVLTDERLRELQEEARNA